MSDLQFTYDWYAELLDRILAAGHEVTGYRGTVGDGQVVLRHDVDWSPRKAVELAEIEADAGVSSTYFFLVSSPFYNVRYEAVRDAIQRLLELGHEVGLHFSTHQYDLDETSTDREIERLVEEESTVLETVTGTDVDLVSFHNPPEWTFRRSFEGFLSAYETRFFEDVAYVADSNQRWRSDDPFDGGIPAPMQLLTHPILWGERDATGIDRLREERDYLFETVGAHIEQTYNAWEGHYGL